MRLILKVFFFPITLVLTIFIALCRFICDCSGALLSVVSLLVFTLAALTLILLRDPKGALITTIVAFIISPYGIHKLADWILDRLEDLNFTIKSI